MRWTKRRGAGAVGMRGEAARLRDEAVAGDVERLRLGPSEINIAATSALTRRPAPRQATERTMMAPPESIQDVAARVGYDSEAVFTRAFKRATGSPAGTWRKGALHA